MLFFPKKWANSIVRWIAGVHSPTGTISVQNTMSPNDDGSLALDVNVGALAKEIMERLELRPYTQVERSRFQFHLRGSIDGVSLEMSDGHVGVSAEWINNRIREYIQPDASGNNFDFLTADDLADILDEAGFISSADYPDFADYMSALGDGISVSGNNAKKVVTGVRWNGTSLVYDYALVTLSHGLVTEWATASNQYTTINTPTVIAWS